MSNFIPVDSKTLIYNGWEEGWSFNNIIIGKYQVIFGENASKYHQYFKFAIVTSWPQGEDFEVIYT